MQVDLLELEQQRSLGFLDNLWYTLEQDKVLF